MANLRRNRQSNAIPPELQAFLQGSQQQAPYEQSRYSLRERFGSRRIDGSAPESPRNARMFESFGTPDQATGQTDKDRWDTFFTPLTPETSMMASGATGRSFKSLGVSGGDRAAETAGAVPMQTPMTAQNQPLPTRQPTAPADYLKTAFDRSTKFWNNLGIRIPTPGAGQVQAGTSFRGQFGEGRVDAPASIVDRIKQRRGLFSAA